MMTCPPLPPSPPSGPPLGTNFSRRKLTQPLPPSPALTWIWASSTNIPVTTLALSGQKKGMVADHPSNIQHPGFRRSDDVDPSAVELHGAVGHREERVVPAHADV